MHNEEIEVVRTKVLELCPEIKLLGIHPVILGKGHRY
ncbi:hypothetical protein DSTSK_29600 [Desulforhabdus sp. TSK]|nr:hypothetical protein DSTSK_29600 [Desulforhabdus sp. TSK]